MDNVQIVNSASRHIVNDSAQPVASLCVPEDVAQLSEAVPLRDGTVVRVRPIRPDDTQRLQSFHARLSPETIEYRYFGPVPVLTTERAEWLTHVDYEQRMALVATVGTVPDDEQIIAVVRYEGVDQTTAEVAFLVEDAWQGHGIATQLLYRLALYARHHGFTMLVAEIMGSNYRMREVISHAGFPITTRYDSGCVEMRMDITATPTAPFAPHLETAAHSM
jgi:RimJ/RimL family protein N-acetyltransferase